MRWSLAVALLGTASASAQKADGPRITAFAPGEIVPGTTSTVRVRGVKLSGATGVKFANAPNLMAEIRAAKAADIPNGLEAKDVGDSQLELSISAPADLVTGAIGVRIVTGGGITPERVLRVAAAVELIEEKEPNGGFREAQVLEFGKTMRATLKEDKDVDVFVFTAAGKMRVAAEVIASRGASLLDPVLTLHDARGQQLATNDDAVERDARIACELPGEGRYFLTVQDAHDRGGSWHAYSLIVKEEQ